MADLLDERRCRATSKRSGKQCRRFPVPGGRVCVIHGGASPQAREAARRRLVDAEATSMLEALWDPSAAPVINPVESLAKLAGKAEHALDVLGARVTVGDLDGPAGVAWTRVMRELRQMLEGLDRLGLEERRVRLAEMAGAQIAAVLRRALERLMLTEEQHALALVVVPEELRRLDEPAEVVRGEVE